MDVHPALTKDHAGLVCAVINRAEAQVLRLSMLYALLNRTKVIEPIHLQAALAVRDYCEASARLIFGNLEFNPYSRRIMAAVKAGPKSMTDLHALFCSQPIDIGGKKTIVILMPYLVGTFRYQKLRKRLAKKIVHDNLCQPSRQ